VYSGIFVLSMEPRYLSLLEFNKSGCYLPYFTRRLNDTSDYTILINTLNASTNYVRFSSEVSFFHFSFAGLVFSLLLVFTYFQNFLNFDTRLLDEDDDETRRFLYQKSWNFV
jgi:hypothetical protein